MNLQTLNQRTAKSGGWSSQVSNAVWIAWERQLRNKSMASKLGVKLYVVECKGSRITRYVLSSYKTLLILWRARPRIVFAQNPSLVLTYALLCLRPFFKYVLVSDAHFGGVVAYNGKPILQRILDYCNRRADLVIVTNEKHAEYIGKIGGRSFVCEDPLPDLSMYSRGVRSQHKTILFVCSFDIDEPYEIVFELAHTLAQEGFTLLVSGDYHRIGLNPAQFPSVSFLGHRPESEFYESLFGSQVVVDLTTQDNCLVCGAYEALAAEKPLVTSDTTALRQYFTHGAVYAQHTRESLVGSIKFAYENRKQLRKDIVSWKRGAIRNNHLKIQALGVYLSEVRG